MSKGSDKSIAFIEFVKIAKRAKAKGVEKWSSRAIFEVIRSESKGEIEVNNNWSRQFSILAMEKYPDLKGMFVVRESKKK